MDGVDFYEAEPRAHHEHLRADSRSWLVTARAQAAALTHGRGLVAAPADGGDGS
jgi:hypothetical protein